MSTVLLSNKYNYVKLISTLFIMEFFKYVLSLYKYYYVIHVIAQNKFMHNIVMCTMTNKHMCIFVFKIKAQYSLFQNLRLKPMNNHLYAYYQQLVNKIKTMIN